MGGLPTVTPDIRDLHGAAGSLTERGARYVAVERGEMKYKCLFLDFYGTLVEEDTAIIDRILRHIAERSPVSGDTSEIGRAWGFGKLCEVSFGDQYKSQRTLELESLTNLFSRFGIDDDAPQFSQELFRYWVNPTPYEDSEEFLAQVPVPVCIVSNIDTADLQAAMRTLGWGCNAVVTSEMCRAYKPRPEVFRRALGVMGVSPREVLHVGDSIGSDVLGAQRVGIDVAWVNRSQRRLPEEMTPLNYSTPDLRTLLQHLCKKNGED